MNLFYYNTLRIFGYCIFNSYSTRSWIGAVKGLVKSNPALEFTRDCSALEIHTDSNIESTSEFVCR